VIVAGAGVIGTQYITQLGTDVATFVSEKTFEKACELRQNPIDDDSQFKILVSPLSNDPDEKHTNRVMTAFGGERGFRVFPICESLKLIYKPGTDTQTSEEEVLQRGRDMIKTMHADLLLFGNVDDLDHSLRIYGINEHGGCDFHPKQTIFPYDSLRDKFNEEEKKKLLAVSIEEIAAACLNQPSIDWPLFAKRINKMEKYVTNLPSLESEDPVLFGSYADGMYLLYSNDQGYNWFSKDKSFILKVIDVLQSRGNDKGLSLMWECYGELLKKRSEKNSNIDDEHEAFIAWEKSITLDPKNAAAYENRGRHRPCHRRLRQSDRTQSKKCWSL
jgi:hypothetical protein